jgi:hypothetical protein
MAEHGKTYDHKSGYPSDTQPWRKTCEKKTCSAGKDERVRYAPVSQGIRIANAHLEADNIQIGQDRAEHGKGQQSGRHETLAQAESQGQHWSGMCENGRHLASINADLLGHFRCKSMERYKQSRRLLRCHFWVASPARDDGSPPPVM